MVDSGEQKQPASVAVAKGLSFVVSLGVFFFAFALAGRLGDFRDPCPRQLWFVDWAAHVLVQFDPLLVALIGIMLLAVSVGLPLETRGFANGLSDWPRYRNLSQYILAWVGWRLVAVAIGFALPGAILLVHPGHYNRWLGLLLILPFVLYALYDWHTRRLDRLRQDFVQPMSTIS